MDSQFSSQSPITKLSTITRNLSGSPSRRVFESLKSITDIRKIDLKEDLSKKYFGVFSNDYRNDSLKDLMNNEFKSIKSKQCLRNNTNVFPKDNLNTKDQSVQTDIREFAKIKLSSDLCESSSNYMQFAEQFIQQLESQCFHNRIHLTSIPTHRSRQTDFHSTDIQFDVKNVCIDQGFNYPIYGTEDISNPISRQLTSQRMVDMNFKSGPLILESNVIEYEADNCQDYEFGEEAVESQLPLFYPKIEFRSENVPKLRIKSEPQTSKWSDLLQLIKLNQVYKQQKALEKYLK